MYKPGKLGQWQAAWIKSLKSGIHRQTKGKLTRKHRDGSWGHCCLGLACEVSITNGIDLSVQVNNNIVSYNLTFESLPKSEEYRYGFYNSLGKINIGALYAMERNGKVSRDEMTSLLKEFDEMRGTCKKHGNNTSLAMMNDSGKTFEQIAAFVERFPRTVFKSSR
ncbi:MAG: hypothetical protein HC888_05385 [Candidatus Competibacteraceae bacterium]|nr:hypothetical protein [Candidatus Competibacteraceae bacterium]